MPLMTAEQISWTERRILADRDRALAALDPEDAGAAEGERALAQMKMILAQSAGRLEHEEDLVSAYVRASLGLTHAVIHDVAAGSEDAARRLVDHADMYLRSMLAPHSWRLQMTRAAAVLSLPLWAAAGLAAWVLLS